MSTYLVKPIPNISNKVIGIIANMPAAEKNLIRLEHDYLRHFT